MDRPIGAPSAEELEAAAIGYARRGFRVIPNYFLLADGKCECDIWRAKKGYEPCHTPGKHPRFREYPKIASTDERQIRKWWKGCGSANVGVVTGKQSRLMVLDTDPRNGGDWARAALVRKYGALPESATCATGGGGSHEHFLWPAELETTQSMVALDDGLEVLLEGHNVVMPPSFAHLGRQPYFWDGDDTEIPAAPAWLVEIIRSKLVPVAAGATRAAGGEKWPAADLGGVLRGCAWMRHCSDHAPSLNEPEWYAQLSIVGRCENGEKLAHELSRPHPKYKPAETSAKLRRAIADAGPVTCSKVRFSLGGERFCVECPNAGIKSPIVLGVPGRRVKKSGGPVAAAGRADQISQNGAGDAPATEVHTTQGPQIAEPVATPAQDDWRAGLICKASGEPKPILANAITALRASPEWCGVLAWNEFSLDVVTARAPIFGGKPGGCWTDQEDRLCADWLQHAGILVSVEVAGQAVQAVARDRSYHPVRDYLTALKWDGTKRLEGWLNLYLGAEVSEYCSAVGERYMRSAVARIMEPGCKVDCCLILEGEQGIRKSTALKTLGAPWFTDELADLGSKDAALQTRGIWLIEIAELDGMTRAEVGKIKAFMSRAVDRFRPPYGRHLLESPRQCVFAGSVNHGAYLRDETGGRRFWPVTCTRILIDDLARDRDQLWAEAFATYREGKAWWLETSELNRKAQEEQSQRYEGSAWDEIILDWATKRVALGLVSVSVAEVLELCIQKAKKEWTRADQMTVSSCLRSAGWKRYRERGRGLQEWRWRAPDEMLRPTSGRTECER